jgi:Ca-activated chloride channel family protein
VTWLNPTYAWALALVVLAALLLLYAAWRRAKALERFGEVPLVAKLAQRVSPRRRRYKGVLLVAGLLCLVVALVGPRYGTQLREVEREGIDLVIALDVSLSMQAEDVAPSRLARAKNEIKKLLDDLRGDRVGLVIFAGDAFIQCPLTSDYNAVRLFLDVAEPSLVPTPGTDFGAALARSFQALEVPETEPDAARTQAVLIVSDGENHVADLDRLVADAEERGVLVFAAGVGETEGAPIPIYSNGRRQGFKTDRQGNTVSTRLEEEALQTLASGGAYFRVGRTSSTLPQLVPALQRLERATFGAEEFETYNEQFQIPLALGLLLLLGEVLLSDRRRRAEAQAATA